MMSTKSFDSVHGQALDCKIEPFFLRRIKKKLKTSTVLNMQMISSAIPELVNLKFSVRDVDFIL